MASHKPSGDSRKMTTMQREESTDRQRAERKLKKEQRNKVVV